MKNKLIILLLVFTIILSGCGSKGKTEEKEQAQLVGGFDINRIKF